MRTTTSTSRDAPNSRRDHGLERADSRAWMTLGVVAGGLFLAVLTTTVVSVALPKIGGDLHASATDLQWIVDAYVLVYASLLVAGGVLGDRLGRKGVFAVGVALFGVGSLISGLAPSVPVLLAARALQGLGPALLVPGSLAIIRATFEEERQRATAIGLWSTSSGIALAIGPVLGGLIVQALGWRWVFLLGAPLSGMLLILALALLPRIPRSPSRTRFDWPGASLVTVAVAALAFAIIEGQQRGWTSAPILSAFAVSLAALAALVVWSLRRPEPLIDVRLFRWPQFTAANVAAMIVFFAFVGAIVYFSSYFQQVQARSPIQAGLDVSAIGIAFALAATLSGRLVGRVGPRLPMITGLLVAGGATLGLLRLTPRTPVEAIWWNFALLGAGIGLCLTPMTSIAISAVESSRAGMASAIHNALRQLGQVLGVAILGALVYAHLPNKAAGHRLAQPLAIAFVRGLHHAIWLSALALFAAGLLTVLVFLANRIATRVVGRRPAAASPTRRPAPAPTPIRSTSEFEFPAGGKGSDSTWQPRAHYRRQPLEMSHRPRRSQVSTTQATSNKQTFRRFHDALNSRDVEFISETIDEMAEPDMVVHTPLPVETTGAETLKNAMAMLVSAFPDIHLTIEDLIEEGDKVVGRNAFGGTHRGEYLGLSPSGKRFAIEEIVIFRFADGRIAESWAVVDVFSQLKQLGATLGGSS